MNAQATSRRKSQLICIFVLVALMISLAGCSATPVPPSPTVSVSPPPPTQSQASVPLAPVIDPGGAQIMVEAGKKIPIRATAAGATEFDWTLQGDGKLSANTGDVVMYEAPATGGGIAIVTVIAANDQGASAPTSLVINVPVAPATATIPLDALAIPAGFMAGTGDPANVIALGAGQVVCHTGTDCIAITYKPGAGWGGIFWWPLTCGAAGDPVAWDKVQRGDCGVNVLDAGGLKTVERLSFWVRGAQGGEVVEFKIGAVDMAPKPGRSLGKVTLDNGWKQKEIDLTGVDLTNAIGLFAWIATDNNNPNGAIFYLDDIQFEGSKR